MGWFKRAVEKVNPPYTPERHEAYLLSLETYNFDADPRTYTYPWLPKVKKFVKTDRGVWYQSGRWYISDSLWKHYVDNLLFPDAHHDYKPAWEPVHVDVDNTGQHWPSRAMVCTRCGDRRDKVSLFVDTARINKDGWCVK